MQRSQIKSFLCLVSILPAAACNLLVPCSEACTNLYENCRVASGGHSYTSNDLQLCDNLDGEDMKAFSLAYCESNCRSSSNPERWSCFADVDCSTADNSMIALEQCTEVRSEPPDTSQSACHDNCDTESTGCGASCIENNWLGPDSCASCFNDCDNNRRSCREWCDLLG